MPRVAFGLALLFLLGGMAWYLGWPVMARPTFTCTLTDPAPCEHTARIADWHLLTGRPMSVEIGPARAEWPTSSDPGFRGAEWAASVERFLLPPIVAACYYSSDEMVTCHAEERAFDPTEKQAVAGGESVDGPQRLFYSSHSRRQPAGRCAMNGGPTGRAA